MLRCLRRVLLAMLLALLVVFAIVWARSYFRYDLAGRDGVHSVAVGSYRGHLLLFCWRNDPQSQASWGHLTGPIAEADDTWQNIQKSASFRLLGFGYAHSPPAGLSWPIAIFVPDWFLMIAAGWPAFYMTRSLLSVRRRRRLGLCLQCGYDLQATPDRCPECGTLARSS